MLLQNNKEDNYFLFILLNFFGYHIIEESVCARQTPWRAGK